MRLIDADELLKQIQTTYCRDCKDCNKDKDFFHCHIEQIIGLIHYAPTVDLWHYIAKGELPPKKKPVFCLLWNGNYVVASHLDDDEWTTNGRFTFDGVRCWQYIVPPKEEA